MRLRYISGVSTTRPILILGGGINGCALARELVINRVPVCVVEKADLSFGATAYSSRLIHGGLRYLEHGEFDLVRESLAERTLLLRLAPQFVRPLRLFIPVSNRFGGVVQSARRFLGSESRRGGAQSRGLWLVRAGLWFYDKYARDPTLPRHGVHALGEAGVPPVNRATYYRLCSYYDAQIRYPERFVMALVEDARRAAEAVGVQFDVLTYHHATLRGRTVEIRPNDGTEPVRSFEPAAIVNATGAWVDETLRRLQVDSKRLIAGTKGSHFVTSHSGLRAALGHDGLYAEADDGRPFFVLPFGERNTLIGTTDLPFDDLPERAVATPEELEYLLRSVNEILPDVRLQPSDIDLHYSGVRPLPATDRTTPGAITRRHWLEANERCPVPLYSVIGGKLTTCRSLAEESVATILERLDLPRMADSRERVLPGGEDFPHDAAQLQRTWQELAKEISLPPESIRAVWELCGTRTGPILRGLADGGSRTLAGTSLPHRFARWVVEHEFPRTLCDLIERRLMLLYDPGLSEATLSELADLLIQGGRLPAGERKAEIERTRRRLREHFGKALTDDSDRAPPGRSSAASAEALPRKAT